MADIATGNVDIYIRQLLSEALGNDVDTPNMAAGEKLLKDENLELTHRRLDVESKDK